jgi:hypothetical protein
MFMINWSVEQHLLGQIVYLWNWVEGEETFSEVETVDFSVGGFVFWPFTF